MRKFNTRWWKMAATVLAVAAISSLGVSAANADSTSVADDHAPIDSLVGGDGPPDIVVSEPDHSLAVRDHDVAIELPGQLISEGGSAQLLEDGAVSLRDRTGDLLGFVRAPWAIDAGGATVPTSFSVEPQSTIRGFRSPIRMQASR